MRTSLLATILAAALLAAPACAGPHLAGPPQELKVPSFTEHEGSLLLLSRIYPVGWSPQGLFAYVYEPADEACGCYFFELIVQDLKTDRVAWQFKYSTDELGSADPQQFDNLAEVWHAKQKELTAKLQELGIVRLDQPAPTLFSSGPEKLSIKIASETKGDDAEVFVHLGKYEIELAGPKGRKTIFRSDEAGVTTDTFGPLEAAATVYLRSPYENRIAVLIEEKWRGYEGPPNVIRLRFAGADLERGF
jgi:hypothetical protein